MVDIGHEKIIINVILYVVVLLLFYISINSLKTNFIRFLFFNKSTFPVIMSCLLFHMIFSFKGMIILVIFTCCKRFLQSQLCVIHTAYWLVVFLDIEFT